MRPQEIRNSTVCNFVLYWGVIWRRRETLEHVFTATNHQQSLQNILKGAWLNTVLVITIGGSAVQCLAHLFELYNISLASHNELTKHYIRMHKYSTAVKHTYMPWNTHRACQYDSPEVWDLTPLLIEDDPSLVDANFGLWRSNRYDMR